MNKKITLILIPLLLLGLLPFASATTVYFVQNNNGAAAGYGQYFDNTFLNVSQTFTSITTAYVTSATITLYSNDATNANHPEAYFRAGLYHTNASGYPDLLSPIEMSPDVFHITSTSDGEQFTLSYTFSGTKQLIGATGYAFVISATYVYINIGTDYFIIKSSVGGITNGASYRYSTGWTLSNPDGYDATGFVVTGTTGAGATTAPAGSPDDFWNTGIGAQIFGFLPTLTSLIVVLMAAFLGWKFAGPWGFFAGINLGYIVSVMFGILPLWGFIALLVVDGLLLFGKVGFHN